METMLQVTPMKMESWRNETLWINQKVSRHRSLNIFESSNTEHQSNTIVFVCFFNHHPMCCLFTLYAAGLRDSKTRGLWGWHPHLLVISIVWGKQTLFSKYCVIVVFVLAIILPALEVYTQSHQSWEEKSSQVRNNRKEERRIRLFTLAADDKFLTDEVSRLSAEKLQLGKSWQKTNNY